MTSRIQIRANRQNAAHSTGPKTPAGKGRSSRNALRHGLRSDVPVLPGERVEEWEAHRAGILHSLAPAGALETELAGRVALCLWRLRRVAAYETATTALGIEQVEEGTRRQAEKLDDLRVKLTEEHNRPTAVRLAQAEQELAEARKTL